MSQEYESRGLEPLFDQYLNELAYAKRMNACNTLRKLWEGLLAQQGTKGNLAALMDLVGTLESYGVTKIVMGKQLAGTFTPQDLVQLGEGVNYKFVSSCKQPLVLEAVGYPLDRADIVCSFQDPSFIDQGQTYVHLGPLNSGIARRFKQTGNRISDSVDLTTELIKMLTGSFSCN